MLSIHIVQIYGERILHIVSIAGIKMIEAGIDGLSRGNNLGGGGVVRSGAFEIHPISKRS